MVSVNKDSSGKDRSGNYTTEPPKEGRCGVCIVPAGEHENGRLESNAVGITSVLGGKLRALVLKDADDAAKLLAELEVVCQDVFGPEEFLKKRIKWAMAAAAAFQKQSEQP